MKLITAILRPDRLNDVLESLFEIDVHGLTITRCLGHGGEQESVETYRGMTVKMELTEKVKVEIGVSDSFVERTIEAIVHAGRTGEVGDGKVFVTPVSEVVRIRTGERDQEAVTPTAFPVVAAF